MINLGSCCKQLPEARREAEAQVACRAWPPFVLLLVKIPKLIIGPGLGKSARAREAPGLGIVLLWTDRFLGVTAI